MYDAYRLSIGYIYDNLLMIHIVTLIVLVVVKVLESSENLVRETPMIAAHTNK